MQLARTHLLLAGLSAVLCPFVHAAERQRPSNAEIHFRLANPCPSTGDTGGACPGYVIDRVIPVVCGGAEDPDNMQWQSLAEAREKDRWERIGCRAGRKLVLPGHSTSFTEAFPTGEVPGSVEAEPLPPSQAGPTQPSR
jgi:hypothetical protein